MSQQTLVQFKDKLVGPLAVPTSFENIGRAIRKNEWVNFKAEYYDFPNSTLSVSTENSEAWVDQLNGITGVIMSVATGLDVNDRLSVKSIVRTGLYQTSVLSVYAGLAYIPVESNQELIFDKFIYASPFAVTMGIYQGPTIAGPIDALANVKPIMQQIQSLETQLDTIDSLPPKWDGEDAAEFSSQTIKIAKRIIGFLRSASLTVLKTPKAVVGPLPDGSVRFEMTHRNKELFLTIHDDDIEVQRWQPLESIKSEGLWEVDLEETKEHLAWLLA